MLILYYVRTRWLNPSFRDFRRKFSFTNLQRRILFFFGNLLFRSNRVRNEMNIQKIRTCQE